MVFLVLLLCLALAGCGAVGEPLPPLLNIPQPATGLSAVQRGERVLLSWPAPTLTMEGVAVRPEKLGPVALYRAVLSGLRTTVTLQEFQAAALEAAKLDPGSVEYADRANPAWAGHTVVYAVLMPNRRGESAGFSNLAPVPILETPPAPELRVRLTEAAVVLEWRPQHGAAYRVYRDGQPLATVTAGLSGVVEYLDHDFEFGREYLYLLRGLGRSEGFTAEGSDSNVVTITPEDTFPPQPPQGLRAVAVQGAVGLSWTPNSEDDLAGYNVYRGPLKLNRELLVSPTFRDAAPGASPRYTVTAVDRRGNESAHSQEVAP